MTVNRSVYRLKKEQKAALAVEKKEKENEETFDSFARALRRHDSSVRSGCS
jgi:hypothetical protein